MSATVQPQLSLAATPAPANVPPPSEPGANGAPPAQARYPMPAWPKHLSQRDSVGFIGMKGVFLDAVANNTRFRADFLGLMKANGIPYSDTDAALIVAGLRFLTKIDTQSLPDAARGPTKEIQSEAQARLDAFLQSSKAFNDSGGSFPSPPMMSNIRNNAAYLVNKYLGTNGVVIPNFPKDIPGQVGV
jgi:hypothetical protein